MFARLPDFLGPNTLGHVAQDNHKHVVSFSANPSYGGLQWKIHAVCAKASDSYDPGLFLNLLGGLVLSGHVCAIRECKTFGNEARHRLVNRFGGRTAKYVLGGWIEQDYTEVAVQGQDAVGRVTEHLLGTAMDRAVTEKPNQ